MHGSRTPRPGTARQAQPPFRVACRPLDWDLSAADALRLVRHDAHRSRCLAPGRTAATSSPPARQRQLTSRTRRSARTWPGRQGKLASAADGSATSATPRRAGSCPPPPPGEPRRLPACWFGYYDHVLRRDRATGRWFFEALITPGREQLLEQRLAELFRRAGTPGPGPTGALVQSRSIKGTRPGPATRTETRPGARKRPSRPPQRTRPRT